MSCLDQAAKPHPQHALERHIQVCTLAPHLNESTAHRYAAEERSHSYINLPLPVPLSKGTVKLIVPVKQISIPDVSPVKFASPNDSIECGNDQANIGSPVVSSNINQAEDCSEAGSPPHFCWSPRFPPDGAANCSVPSSPTAKFDANFELLNTSKDKLSSSPVHLCMHQADGVPKLCHCIPVSLSRSSADFDTTGLGKTESSLMKTEADNPSVEQVSQSSQSNVPFIPTVDLLDDKTRHTSATNILPEGDRNASCTESAALPLVSTPQHFSLPPASSASANTHVVTTVEYTRTRPKCYQSEQVGSHVTADNNVDNINLSKIGVPIAHSAHRPQQLVPSSLLASSLSPAPEVPSRDPTTALQQDNKSRDTAPAAPGLSACARSISPNAQSALDMTVSNLLSAPKRISKPQGSLVGNSDRRLKQQADCDLNMPTRKSPFSVLKPNVCRPITDTTTTAVNVTTVSSDYDKSVSLHKHATSSAITDGRTVVPWCLGTRELVESSSHSKTVEDDESNFLAGFVSTSSSFYDSSPQWIRPDLHSTDEKRTSEVTQDPKDFRSMLESDRTPTHIGRGTRERPKYLTENFEKQATGVVQLSRAVSCRSEWDRRGPTAVSNGAASGPKLSSLGAPRHFYLSTCRNTEWSSAFAGETGAVTSFNVCSSNETETPTTQHRPPVAILSHQKGSRRPVMLNENELLHRQISAGPSFNLSPTKSTSLSNHLPNAIGITNTMSSYYAAKPLTKDLFPRQRRTTDGGTTIHQASSHTSTRHRDVIPQTLAVPLHNLVNQKPLTTDPNHINRRSGRQEFERHHFAESGSINSCNYADHSGRGYPPSMTQSVLFPSHAAWISCREVSPKSKQASSVSGRRRRCKTGLSRSHSQRIVDEFDTHLSTNGTVPNSFGDSLSSTNYQRSTSHTVPMQSSDVGGAWPPVLAQWHHRKTDVNGVEDYHLPADTRRLTRDQPRFKSGRSSHNLFTFEGGKPVEPHCRSASAIFERLDKELWFHSDLSRVEAERLLKSTRPGSFLVRQSETSKSEYSLSIRRDSGVLHMKISHDPSSGQYVLGEYSQPYPSITAMIHRYSKSLLPVRGTTPILLRYPIDRKVPL